jgi:serine/threonine protein kinase
LEVERAPASALAHQEQKDAAVMLTTDLGACEWFVWDLRRSNLLDRGQLDQVVGEFLEKNPRAEPAALSDYLVAQGILTPFQAERLLQGKTQGFVLGPYTLMDALGAGSMGTVYKAQSKNDNQWYAVKVLPRRSMWNVRIARRKVRAFESCRHPAVVPFVDVGTSGGMHYLTWKLVEGETLDKVLQKQSPLPLGQAAYIAQQVAEGLHTCHQQGLFHGLLKPSNLMIGPEQQVSILDFGIGCLLAETEGESLVDTMSTANSVASGLDCASPESIMDPTNLTPAGDQYSLGCVLYYLLTGQFPFPDGTAAEKMMAHQVKQPTPVVQLNPEVPAELIDVVERLMQKTPESRFANAGDVVEALQPFAQTPVRAANLPRASNLRGHPVERLRASARSLADTPQPASRPTPEPPARTATNGPLLPTRNSLRGGQQAPAEPKVETPAQPAAKAEVPEVVEESGRRSWEDRMGPLGIAAAAILACVVAWLLTWKLF